MNESRPVKLFRDGPEQAVHIPREFELPGTDAVMRKQGDSLIIEPKKTEKKDSLKALLASWEPLDEEWPDIPDLPADPVDL
jgi:antitoxin VapB